MPPSTSDRVNPSKCELTIAEIQAITSGDLTAIDARVTTLEGQVADLTPGEWADLSTVATYASTWVTADADGSDGWGPAQVRVIGDRVEFRGAVKSSGAIVGNTVFTVGAALRPHYDANLQGVIADGSALALFGVVSSGAVTTDGPLTHPAYINLDNAAYSITTAPA